MRNLKNYTGILLLCMGLTMATGCNKADVTEADKQVEIPEPDKQVEAPDTESKSTEAPAGESTPTVTPEPEESAETPTAQVLHTVTETNSAGETVRSVYTLEDDVVVLNKYKLDVLVYQEKWNDGALEFGEEGVFQTPELSFWCRFLDGEDVHATTYTEMYTDTAGTLQRLIKGTVDGDVLYDEVHEYGGYDREDGVRILTEQVSLNGVLAADAEYGYFSSQVPEKRPVELNFYPVKGARITLGHQEGNPAFLQVTEDASYECSGHIRECYLRDETGQLVSGQAYVDGVLAEEYELTWVEYSAE